MLLWLILLVAYVFVRDQRTRSVISGVLAFLSLLVFLAGGGLLNLVITALWGYLFYRDVRAIR